MHIKIHEFATVITGYTFRGAIDSKDAGTTSVFQAGDLVQGVPFEDVASLAKVTIEVRGHPAYLKKRDVLILSRGMRSTSFRSTVFQSDAQNVLASSSVHVIRLTSADLLPEYVSQYLNAKEGQEALASIISGSYIVALSRRALENLSIPVPSLDKQKMFLQLAQNVRDQQTLLKRKTQLTEEILGAAFTHLVNA